MKKSAGKFFRRTLRVIAFLLLFIIIALVSGVYFLNTDRGHKWLAAKATSILTEKLKTEVSMADIRISLPLKISIYDIHIKDYRHNDIIDAAEVKVSAIRYNFVNGNIHLGHVEVANGDFNVRKYNADKKSNYDFLMDNLIPKKQNHKGKPAVFAMDYVDLKHINFSFFNEHVPDTIRNGFDVEHVNIKDINSITTYLSFYGDEVRANIKSFSFSERNGFVVKDMHGDISYNSHELEARDFYFLTPQTELRDYAKLEYKQLSSLSYFIDSVKLTTNLIDSKVSFKDIHYFAPTLLDSTEVVSLSGKSTGTIADLHVRDIDIAYGRNTRVRGKGEMKGLPDINETFIDVRASEAQTDRAELMKLFPEASLPQQVDVFGIVSAKGSYTGFIYDFVSNASFKTALGNATSDLNLKIPMGGDTTQPSYSGKISLMDFNLGTLLGQKVVGTTTLDAEIKGRSFDLNKIQATLKADISHFDLNSYSYKNINVNGQVAKKFFNGSLNINDSNLQLAFLGSVDYAKGATKFDFTADLKKADLYKMNLSPDSLQLSAKANINVTGSKPDDLNGVINIKSIAYSTGKNQKNTIDSLYIFSKIDSTYRILFVSSPVVKATLQGNFSLTHMGDMIKNIGSNYIDSSFLKTNPKSLTDQYINFDVSFNNLDPVFKLFHSHIAVSDSGYLNGNIHENGGIVHATGFLPGVRYNNLFLENLSLDANGANNNLALNIHSTGFYIKDSMMMRGIDIKTNVRRSRIDFQTYACDMEKKKEIYLNGKLNIKADSASLVFDSASRLIAIGKTWKIGGMPVLFYGDSLIDVQVLSFSRAGEDLKIIGKYSTKRDEPIRFVLEDFSISTITSFFPAFDQLHGNLNGQILLSNVQKSPIIEASLFATPLVYGKDTLGIFKTVSDYDQSTQKLNISSYLNNMNEKQLMGVSGNISFSGEQPINLNATFDQTKIKIFEPFFAGLASDFKGLGSADVTIGGTISNPIIKGTITLDSASMKVDYLQTVYTFTHTFSLDGKVINIHNLELHDAFKNLAIMNGKINITHLSDLGLDLQIKIPDRFQLLNTKNKDNKLYYGTAFGSGRISITGPLSNINMDLHLRSEKGTVFNLPIGGNNVYSGHDEIHFVTKADSIPSKISPNLSGLSLSFALEVTPDAKMMIALDGDLLEANGRGNLQLDFTPDGNFEMSGPYTISSGTYTFNLSLLKVGLIKRHFKIEDGSSIVWRGDAYDATINLNAHYEVITSLSPLLVNTFGPTLTSQNVPVEAEMRLTGMLMKPTIKLDFDIPTLGNYVPAAQVSEIEPVITAIKQDSQQLNTQVAMLLTVGEFIAPNQGLGGAGNLSSGVYAQGYEGVGNLVSGELNNLLNNHHASVNLIYQGGTQFNLAASEALNNQVTISGAYGQNGGVTTQGQTAQSATGNVATNYNVEIDYKKNDQSNVSYKVFNRYNNDNVLVQTNNTFGAGITFSKEFDKVKDLFRRKKKKTPDPSK